MINIDTTIDITTLDFIDTPHGFGTEYNGKITNIFTGEMTGFGDHGDLIIDYNLDFGRASLALNIGGTWYDSTSTQDWPVFDKCFGRAAWQEFLADFEQECQDELDDDE